MAAGLLLLLACQGGEAWEWQLPEGFPVPYVPEDNPMSAQKVALGRRLFYDVRLSGNETQSCGTCHLPELGFTDGLGQAEGSTGEPHRRGAMALANVGYFSGLTWASRSVRTLEDQALVPIFGEHPVELGMAGREEELLDRLAADAEYPGLFAAAFPEEDDPLTLSGLTRAIAAFERTLLSGGAPYDRYIQGDRGALGPEAVLGMELFFSERLECFHCHGGFAFTDSVKSELTVFDELAFHNTGLYNVDGAGAYPASDQGLYELTGVPSDMGRFRAPSLRNIAVTAPYMHDGSIATLDEVLDHYAAGGRTLTEGPNTGVGSENPYKSQFLVGFTLDEEERAAVLAFLDALTDEAFLSNPDLADPFAD